MKRIVTDEEFKELLNHLKFHITNKKKIKNGKINPVELPISDEILHQQRLICRIPNYVLSKEQADIYFKDFNHDDIQYFDFYYVVWLLKCLYKNDLTFPIKFYRKVKEVFLRFFIEIIERSSSINLDITELFRSFIIDNLNRFFISEERIEILCLLLKINENETLNYLDEYNEDLKLFNKKEIKRAKELIKKEKELNKNTKQNNKKLRKRDYIRIIKEETELSKSEIQQLVEEKKNKYNFKISDKGILYLIIMDLIKRKEEAPQCKGMKKDGTRCKKRIKHSSGYCPHHR